MAGTYLAFQKTSFKFTSFGALKTETIRNLPLCTESEATIFLATIKFLTVCALTQTICAHVHTHIDALYTHDMTQTYCASYFASIFSLHNNVDPEISKSNSNFFFFFGKWASKWEKTTHLIWYRPYEMDPLHGRHNILYINWHVISHQAHGHRTSWQAPTRQAQGFTYIVSKWEKTTHLIWYSP